jgi:hypothetical protein
MSFGWWTILETKGKRLSMEKNSLVAILDKTMLLAPTTIPRSKALKYFVLPINLLSDTYTQSMSQDLKTFFKFVTPTSLKWIELVTSIRAHSF